MKTLIKQIYLVLALLLGLFSVAANAGERLVTPAWDAQADATSFAVYSSTGALLSTSSTNEATIIITDTLPTTVYVTAINEAGESDASEYVTIRIKPGAPKKVRIIRITRTPSP